MASGPYWNPRRGTWSVQWFDGTAWRRAVVVGRQPGWNPGDPRPRKKPPEALAAVLVYQEKEKAATKRGGRAIVGQFDPRSWLLAWLGRRVDVATATVHQAAMAIDVFAEWCRREGITRVDQIDDGACASWMKDRSCTIAVRSGKPISRATLKKEKGLLMKAWSEAVEQKTLAMNPWDPVKVPGRDGNKRRGSWTPEQFERLRLAARPWLRDILTIGVMTGLRINALCRLEWRDVRFPGAGEAGFGWIDVRPEVDKSKVGYGVPINQKCHDVLARRRIHRDAHATFVLTGGHDNAMSARSGTTARAIKRACCRAGLRTPDSPTHHMRRTFGRWAVLGHLTGEPVPLYVVSKWMGHASLDMTELYLQLTDSESQRYMVGQD